jgi:hydrogenase nickel incorporation protein HypB
VMFRNADLVLITKSDLLGVLDDFSPERAETCLRNLASEAPLYEVSAKNGAGLDTWLHWLGTARSEAA